MLYILLSILINLFNGNSTKIEYFDWHLTFDNEKLQVLNKEGLLIDKVWYGYTHAYTKRKLGEKFYEEYYRINDTLFHYKKSIDTLILEKGYFKINSQKPIESDTVYIACSYDEYEDILQIHKYYKPIKIRHWNYNRSETESLKGNFKEGKKHGKWTHVKENIKVKINYQMGDTLGIYNPTKDQLEKQSHWLIGKEYHICSKYLFQYDTLSTKILQSYPIMSNENNRVCDDNLTFYFSDRSNVTIKHNIIEVKMR